MIEPSASAPPRTLLERHIKARGLSQRGAARELGWHPSKLNRYITGARVPDLDDAVTLQHWTGGDLRAEWWAAAPPEEARQCA